MINRLLKAWVSLYPVETPFKALKHPSQGCFLRIFPCILQGKSCPSSVSTCIARFSPHHPLPLKRCPETFLQTRLGRFLPPQFFYEGLDFSLLRASRPLGHGQQAGVRCPWVSISPLVLSSCAPHFATLHCDLGAGC